MKRIMSLVIAILMLVSVLGSASASAEAGSSATVLLPDEIRAELRSYLFSGESEKNVAAAMELIRPLAEEGNAEAQYYMGYIHECAIGGAEEHEREALYWYELSIKQGFVKAYLAKSLNKFVESEEKAEEIAQEAISLGLFDLSDAMLGPDGFGRIAQYYAENEDYDQAMEWYLKAVEAGEACAMNQIGYMYQNGLGVELDYAQAMEWYLKAADAGNAGAMNNIGTMYYYGQGVSQSRSIAIEWFEKAAALGISTAEEWLEFLCEN